MTGGSGALPKQVLAFRKDLGGEPWRWRGPVAVGMLASERDIPFPIQEPDSKCARGPLEILENACEENGLFLRMAMNILRDLAVVGVDLLQEGSHGIHKIAGMALDTALKFRTV